MRDIVYTQEGYSHENVLKSFMLYAEYRNGCIEIPTFEFERGMLLRQYKYP